MEIAQTRTSRAKRVLFSMGPPYLSVRLFTELCACTKLSAGLNAADTFRTLHAWCQHTRTVQKHCKEVAQDLQELINDISIGAMDFHTIKASVKRIARSLPVGHISM